MDKKYTRLEIHGNTFEDVYKKMVKTSQVSGCKIECDFSGSIINSDMSIDEASLKCCGKMYSDAQREREAYERALLQREKIFQDSQEENTLIYKKRGAELISPDKLLDWYKTVDTYMEWKNYAPMLPMALDMIERARDGATIKDLIQFVNASDAERAVRDSAISTAEKYSHNINGLCRYIQTYRTLQGTPDYLIYPDEKGMAMVDEYLQAREPALKEIMNIGPRIVGENYMQVLAELLVSEEKGALSTYQVQDCLEIVDALNSGMDIDDVKDMFDRQAHTKDSWVIMEEVKRLCDRGEEFTEYVEEQKRTGPVIGE